MAYQFLGTLPSAIGVPVPAPAPGPPPPPAPGPARPPLRADAYLFWQFVSGAYGYARDLNPKSLNPGSCVLVLIELEDGVRIDTHDALSGLLPTHCNAMRAERSIQACLVDMVNGDFARLLGDWFGGRSGLKRLEFGGFVAKADIDWPPTAEQRGAAMASIRAGGPVAEIPSPSFAELRARMARALRSKPILPPALPTAPDFVGPVRPASRVMVAVVDDRCSVHSAALRELGSSAIASVWHQGGDRDTLDELDSQLPRHWARPLSLAGRASGGPIGRRQSGAITQMDAGPAPQLPRVRGPGPDASHGSAVMHLVAARKQWVSKRDAAWRWIGIQPRERPMPSGVHFVQLPIPTVLDTAGRSLSCYVLDAIHDAVEQAEPGQNVVVNISFGTHGGGHDGSSMFERALVQMLDHYAGQKDANFGARDASRPKLHVVLPAGNSHLWRCHASARLGPQRPAHRWNI